MIGFCVPCADDVPMSLDRRCLADGSLVLPPSTGCAHQTWLGGSWSTCRCKPIAAGTWRAILSQQAKAIQKRDQDRADRRFKVADATPPKLVKAQQPQRTIGRANPSNFLCSGCSIPGLRRHTDTLCSRCYQTARRRAVGKSPPYRVPTLPCPICERPFQARSYGDGKRRLTCSPSCREQRIAQRRHQARVV